MGLCESTEELDIFETESLKEMIDFKWENYARKFHLFGCFMHFTYVFTMSIFVFEVYVLGDLGN